ncbi:MULTISPECIES: hypothetical protein [unclassified Nocardia]|uniref:hypothetical protein n=1 Tax=unclassified Nocardia TaxID=2637762 RepID=UPI001CE4B34B|nr:MULTISPECIES: hypothetical protein [unclassified Nocardia]
MTSDKFRLDIQEFQAQAPKFAELAQDMESALSELRGALEGDNGKWGGDDLGSAFAQNYVSKADEAMKTIESAVKLFEHLGSSTTKVTKTVQELDSKFKSAIEKGKSELDGGKKA